MGRAGQKPAVTFQEQIVKRKNRKDGHIQKIYGKKLEIVGWVQHWQSFSPRLNLSNDKGVGGWGRGALKVSIGGMAVKLTQTRAIRKFWNPTSDPLDQKNSCLTSLPSDSNARENLIATATEQLS